jgi:hypothetical protein
MRVRFELDGEIVNGALLSAPNAIGVCDVRVHARDLQRHVNRLKPLDDEAAQMLGSGDRFVARDPEHAIDQIVESPKTALRDWTIDDVGLLRVYAYLSLLEVSPGPRVGRRAAEYNRLHVAFGVIKLWIKQARMLQTATEAGLTAEQARDPSQLLRAARVAIVKLTMFYHETTGAWAEPEKRLAETIGNYLTHHAPVGEIPTQERKRR